MLQNTGTPTPIHRCIKHQTSNFALRFECIHSIKQQYNSVLSHNKRMITLKVHNNFTQRDNENVRLIPIGGLCYIFAIIDLCIVHNNCNQSIVSCYVITGVKNITSNTSHRKRIDCTAMMRHSFSFVTNNFALPTHIIYHLSITHHIIHEIQYW